MNLSNLQLNSRLTPLFTFVKKQQEDRKFRKTLELSATFILISFFLFFAIKPTALTISTLVGDIKSKELLSREMRNKITDVISAQDLFSQVQEKYALIDSCLPDLARFSQATNQVDGLLTQNQLETNKLDFSISNAEFFTTTVSTASSFTSGINLITSFLQNRRLMKIPLIKFSTDLESLSSRQVTISFPVDIYYWKKP